MPDDRVIETEGPMMKLSEKARATRNAKHMMALERKVAALELRLKRLETMAGVK